MTKIFIRVAFLVAVVILTAKEKKVMADTTSLFGGSVPKAPKEPQPENPAMLGPEPEQLGDVWKWGLGILVTIVGVLAAWAMGLSWIPPLG